MPNAMAAKAVATTSPGVGRTATKRPMATPRADTRIGRVVAIDAKRAPENAGLPHDLDFF